MSAPSPCSACLSHPEAGGRASRRGQRGPIMSIRLHTPGPRTVDYTDNNLGIYAGDLLIGEVNGSTGHIEVRCLDEENTEANAWQKPSRLSRRQGSARLHRGRC